MDKADSSSLPPNKNFLLAAQKQLLELPLRYIADDERMDYNTTCAENLHSLRVTDYEESEDYKMTVELITCYFCKHFDLSSERSSHLKCKAFPDGIPNKILKGEVKHIKPYPGDHGIQFEEGKEVYEDE